MIMIRNGLKSSHFRTSAALVRWCSEQRGFTGEHAPTAREVDCTPYRPHSEQTRCTTSMLEHQYIALHHMKASLAFVRHQASHSQCITSFFVHQYRNFKNPCERSSTVTRQRTILSTMHCHAAHCEGYPECRPIPFIWYRSCYNRFLWSDITLAFWAYSGRIFLTFQRYCSTSTQAIKDAQQAQERSKYHRHRQVCFQEVRCPEKPRPGCKAIAS